MERVKVITIDAKIVEVEEDKIDEKNLFHYDNLMCDMQHYFAGAYDGYRFLGYKDIDLDSPLAEFVIKNYKDYVDKNRR